MVSEGFPHKIYMESSLLITPRGASQHIAMCFRTNSALLQNEAACCFCLLTRYNRPSPSETLLRAFRNLRTIIVIADIDRGL